MSLLQRLVSKKKRRFEAAGFDLDMSYITDNIIAMGFPSEKFEAMYRNPFDKVFAFFEKFHKDKYRVYNLCSEREYDPSKFHDRVGCYPFDDHNAPPFDLIQAFCDDVRDWLAADDENIAVIHCKAGKGRTGEMICCWLMYTQEWVSPEDSMAYYACMRTYNMKGVTIPSQIRYIYYYYRSLHSGGTPDPANMRTVTLKSVTLHSCPRVKDGIFFQVFRMGDLKTPVFVYEGSKAGQPDDVKALLAKGAGNTKGDSAAAAPAPGGPADPCLVFDDLGDKPIELQGDFMVQWMEGRPSGKSEKLCYVWLNSHFMDDDSLLLKPEIDKAHKDKENKVFAPHFSATVSVRDTAEPPTTPLSSSGKKSRGKKGAKAKEAVAVAANGPTRPQDVGRGRASRPGTLDSGKSGDGDPVVVLNDFPAGTLEAFAEARPAVKGSGAVAISAYLVDQMAEAMAAHAVDGLVTADQMEDVDGAEAVRVNRRECAILRSVSLGSLTTQPARVAFWLNVYNVLSMHANAVYRPTTLKERLHMQVNYKFLIDGTAYCMAEILLFALRAPLPSSIQLERLLRERLKGSKPNQRLPAALTEREFLITFAVNAGAPDAGEVVAYRVESLEDDLEETAQRYLRRMRINVAEHVVWVPRMLNWVKNDFGRTRAERFAILGDMMDKTDRKAWYACGDNPTGLHWSYNDQTLGFNFEHRVARSKRRLVNRTGLGLRTGSARRGGGGGEGPSRTLKRDNLERARSFESHSKPSLAPHAEAAEPGHRRHHRHGRSPAKGHHRHGSGAAAAAAGDDNGGDGDGAPPALPDDGDAASSHEAKEAGGHKTRKRRSSASVANKEKKSAEVDAAQEEGANVDQDSSAGSSSDSDGAGDGGDGGSTPSAVASSGKKKKAAASGGKKKAKAKAAKK